MYSKPRRRLAWLLMTIPILITVCFIRRAWPSERKYIRNMEYQYRPIYKNKSSDLSPYEAAFDQYRIFKTKMFFTAGTDWPRLSDECQVCLSSQSSIDRLHWLIQVTDQWTGPVSVALFVPDIEFHIAKVYIKYLCRCFPRIKAQVSFHLSFPVEHSIVESSLNTSSYEVWPCDSPSDLLSTLLATQSDEMLSWRKRYAYPQNLLRNVAKSGCQTGYIFNADMDMIPVSGLDRDLEDFLSSEAVQTCDKCAFVVPIYEVKSEVLHMPKNKAELLALVHSGQARVFHVKAFMIAQKNSMLWKWEKLAISDKLAQAYNVSKYQFKYEPVYVARANTPAFDERFVGYGGTRNTQIYEMFMAGYKFTVLNNAFAVHWGYQLAMKRPAWRAQQQEQNNARMEQFLHEMTVKYGRDPYHMEQKLRKFNFSEIRLAYDGRGRKKKSSPKTNKTVT